MLVRAVTRVRGFEPDIRSAFLTGAIATALVSAGRVEGNAYDFIHTHSGLTRGHLDEEIAETTQALIAIGVLAGPAPDVDECRRIITKELGRFGAQFRPYHSPLPYDIAPWHVWLPDAGHCIYVSLAQFMDDLGVTRATCPVPVKTVLRTGWTLVEGRAVVAGLRYDRTFGLRVDSGDEER